METIRVVCLGPTRSGKSRICNTLSDLDGSLNAKDYHATSGVRILEFQRKLSKGEVNVQLWDTEGEISLLNSWSHFAPQGLILVGDLKLEKELVTYQESLPGLKPGQICVLTTQPQLTKPKLSHKVLSKASVCTAVNFDAPEGLKADFDRFLESVVEEESKTASKRK